MPDEPIAVLREEYPWGGRICELYHDRLGIRDAVFGSQESIFLPLDLFDPAPSRMSKRIPTPNGWGYLMVAMSVGAVFLGAAWIAVLSYPALVRLGWGLSLVDAEPGELPVASIVRIVLWVLVSFSIAVCMAIFFRRRKREYIAFKHSVSKRGMLDFERFKSNGAELDAFVAKMSAQIATVPPRVSKALCPTMPVPAERLRYPGWHTEYFPVFGIYNRSESNSYWHHSRITPSGIRCQFSGKGNAPSPDVIARLHDWESRLPSLVEIAMKAIPPPPEMPEKFQRESIVLWLICLDLDGTGHLEFDTAPSDEIYMWPSVQIEKWQVIESEWNG